MPKSGVFDLSSPGIFGGRRARRMAAEAEAARRETIGGLDIGVDELVASTADPAEASAWRDQFESFKEMALSQDELLQREGIAGLGRMATAVQGAVDRRRQAQEGFVIEQARDLRERHQKAVEPMRQLQANAAQIDALLRDPDFYQNEALNRGALIGLLQSSTRQMLSDPDDFADALMSAGGGGLVGSLINLAGGTLAAQDFDFSKEDYARIARAMYTFNETRYRNTVAPLELEAAALDQAAAGLDFLPQGYSLTQYVTGGPLEAFESPLEADYSGADIAPPAPQETALTVLGELLAPAESPGDSDRAAEGPQFAGVRPRDTGLLERATGVFDIGTELNAQIAAAVDAGATVRADPQSGALFAIYADGRREELPTSTVKRQYVLNGLKAGQQTVKGKIQR